MKLIPHVYHFISLYLSSHDYLVLKQTSRHINNFLIYYQRYWFEYRGKYEFNAVKIASFLNIKLDSSFIIDHIRRFVPFKSGKNLEYIKHVLLPDYINNQVSHGETRDSLFSWYLVFCLDHLDVQEFGIKKQIEWFDSLTINKQFL